MKLLKALMLVAFMSGMSLALVGCQSEEEGALEQLGKDVDKAAAEATEEAEKAAE